MHRSEREKYRSWWAIGLTMLPSYLAIGVGASQLSALYWLVVVILGIWLVGLVYVHVVVDRSGVFQRVSRAKAVAGLFIVQVMSLGAWIMTLAI